MNTEKTGPDDKLELLELVKNKQETCKISSKPHKSNLMARGKKQPNVRK